jgi:hypothetical protein
MIYEGSNGIQALDLVGRKLPRDDGRAIKAFFAEVMGFAKEQGADEKMKPFIAPLSAALTDLQKATLWLAQNGVKSPDDAAAGSTDYLHLFGLVALGYMWARMARVALDKAADGDRFKHKLVTARFFMEKMLPETALRLQRIAAGGATVMELPAEAF